MKKINQKIFEKEFPITENKKLAKKYECSVGSIRMVAAAFGIKKDKGSEWSKKDEKWLMKYYGFKPMPEILERLKRSRWGIINKFRELKKLN